MDKVTTVAVDIAKSAFSLYWVDAETGEIHLSEVVRVNKQEIAKGAPRAQLIDRASKRVALAIEQFDPYKH